MIMEGGYKRKEFEFNPRGNEDSHVHLEQEEKHKHSCGVGAANPGCTM